MLFMYLLIVNPAYSLKQLKYSMQFNHVFSKGYRHLRFRLKYPFLPFVLTNNCGTTYCGFDIEIKLMILGQTNNLWLSGYQQFCSWLGAPMLFCPPYIKYIWMDDRRPTLILVITNLDKWRSSGCTEQNWDDYIIRVDFHPSDYISSYFILEILHGMTTYYMLCFLSG